MDDLLKLVPEDKHDEFKSAYEAEISKSFINKDDDAVMKFVVENTALKDKITSAAMTTRLNTFKEKELPELLKAERKKVEDELNPPKSKTDIRLAEIETELANEKAAKAKLEGKAQLRETYKEIEPDLAASLYGLSDETITKLMDSVKGYKDKIDELEKKIKYGGKIPDASSKKGDVISRDAFNKMTPKERSAFFNGGGQIQG